MLDPSWQGFRREPWRGDGQTSRSQKDRQRSKGVNPQHLLKAGRPDHCPPQGPAEPRLGTTSLRVVSSRCNVPRGHLSVLWASKQHLCESLELSLYVYDNEGQEFLLVLN